RQGATGTLLNTGKVLIAGGGTLVFRSALATFPALVSADLYDLSTGQFSATGNMNYARCGGTATKLMDGTVLLVGGAPNVPAEIYDPVKGTFSPTGTPVTSRMSGFTATLLQNGKVLFTGGSTNLGCIYNASQVNPQDIVASAEIFDP